MSRIIKLAPYTITSVTYLLMHIVSCCDMFPADTETMAYVSIQTIYYTILFIYISILHLRNELKWPYVVSVVMNCMVFTLGVNHPKFRYLPYVIGNSLLIYLHY